MSDFSPNDASTETPTVSPMMAPAHAAAVGSRAYTARPALVWLTMAVGALAMAAVVVSGLLWQKLDRIQEELARRSLDAGAQSMEARTLARQAQEATRELSVRQSVIETRISEVSLQRTQLEELMQTLSRSRDETLVVDVESALKLAQQQAQLAGTAQPLLAALRAADQRIARAAQPRLNPLQRAIIRDMERIQSANLTDVPLLLVKLDELSRLADELPLANGRNVSQLTAAGGPAASPHTVGAVTAPAKPASQANTDSLWPAALNAKAWAEKALATVWSEASKLLRVSRIDQPEAALLAPDQGFFLRENLKLRLLNARMSLLSRQTDMARSDLLLAAAWISKYFDGATRKVQAAAQLLQQVQGQLKTSELPRLDETMAALATAAAGR